jgi:hypothetical protein
MCVFTQRNYEQKNVQFFRLDVCLHASKL